MQAIRFSDAAAKEAAQVAREEAACQKKQQKELVKRLKVVEQEKLVGPPCSCVRHASCAVQNFTYG